MKNMQEWKCSIQGRWVRQEVQKIEDPYIPEQIRRNAADNAPPCRDSVIGSQCSMVCVSVIRSHGPCSLFSAKTWLPRDLATCTTSCILISTESSIIFVMESSSLYLSLLIHPISTFYTTKAYTFILNNYFCWYVESLSGDKWWNTYKHHCQISLCKRIKVVMRSNECCKQIRQCTARHRGVLKY